MKQKTYKLCEQKEVFISTVKEPMEMLTFPEQVIGCIVKYCIINNLAAIPGMTGCYLLNCKNPKTIAMTVAGTAVAIEKLALTHLRKENIYDALKRVNYRSVFSFVRDLAALTAINYCALAFFSHKLS